MRKTLNETFLNNDFISKFNNSTTFEQLRPILADLFPICELCDLTDAQLKKTVNGNQGYMSAAFTYVFNATGITDGSDIAIVIKMLQRMLTPDEDGNYQPSTEELTYVGIVDGENETKLMSFKNKNGDERYFNQYLASFFLKVMEDFDTVKKGKESSKDGDFFITKRENNIYEMRNDTAQNKTTNNEKIGKGYARSKGWVVPQSAIDREKSGETFQSGTRKGQTKFDITESRYTPSIPAGELSAMLAELSSMESESEYASEDEFEELASEEFASDSSEFASDEF